MPVVVALVCFLAGGCYLRRGAPCPDDDPPPCEDAWERDGACPDARHTVRTLPSGHVLCECPGDAGAW